MIFDAPTLREICSKPHLKWRDQLVRCKTPSLPVVKNPDRAPHYINRWNKYISRIGPVRLRFEILPLSYVNDVEVLCRLPSHEYEYIRERGDREVHGTQISSSSYIIIFFSSARWQQFGTVGPNYVSGTERGREGQKKKQMMCRRRGPSRGCLRVRPQPPWTPWYSAVRKVE